MFDHPRLLRAVIGTALRNRNRSRPTSAVEPLESRAYLSGISFLTPTFYPLAGVNLSTPPVVADFNHDGILDLATANNDISGSQNTVTVLLGTGTGTFTATTTLAGGRRGAGQVVAGDFNGDGNMDIAVTNGQDGTISVFLGNGAGVFGAPIDSTYGTSDNAGTFNDTATLATADLNGDGKPDLIVGDGNDNQLITMLGHGDGTFSISQEQTAMAPGPIVVADFNSDAKLDVATTLGNQRGVSLFLGQGNGTLSTPTAFTVATPADFGTGAGLATGDLNGDGKPDLVVVSNQGTASGAGTLSVLLGDGSGGFLPSKDMPVAADAVSVALGDFNSDLKQDVVVSSPQTGFEVFAGNGDGTFNSTADFTSPVAQAGAVAVADFNADGKPDLAVSQIDPTTINGSHGIGIFLNGQSPASSLSASLSGKLPASAVAGQNSKISQILTVTNGGGAFTGSITGGLFLSTGTTIDARAIALPTTFKKSLSLKAKRRANISLKVASIPATVPAGTYHLLAQFTDPSGNVVVAASSATITVTPPQIDLSGTFVKLPATAKVGKRSVAVISVTNSGSDPATGPLPIIVEASSDQTLAGAVQVATLDPKINLKPGKTRRISIPLSFTAAGSSFLTVLLDPANTLGDINLNNNTFTSGTQVIVS